MLDEIGLGRERLRMVNLSAAMAPTFVERVNEMVETVTRLGPSPLQGRRDGRSRCPMIVASPKPIAELKRLLARHKKVLFVGCGTCVTVCLAGGEREVGIMAYAMRMARARRQARSRSSRSRSSASARTSSSRTWPRPSSNEAVVSFACGAGVQALAERFPSKPVYAGLNTQFLGILEEQAVWTEKCLGCGDCVLSEFGGICPVTRCAKQLLNGPCGGSTEERCEVDPDKPVRLAAHLQAPGEHRPVGPAGGDPPAQGLAAGLARRRTRRSCARNTGSEQTAQS